MAMSGARTFAFAAATTLLSGAACGGGADTPPAAEDKATAQRMVLTSADLPGFEAKAKDTTDDNSANSLDKCLNNNPLLTHEDNPRGADGTEFTKDDGDVSVQSGVFFTKNEAEARKTFSDMKNALSGQCIKDGMKSVIQEGAPAGLVVGDVSASPLQGPKVADDVAATRLTVPLESKGERVSVFVDLNLLRQGREFGGVITFQSGTPFPDAERTRLTTLLGKRMSGKAKNTPDAGPPPTTATTATTGRSSTGGAATSGALVPFSDPSGVSLRYPAGWTVKASGADSPLIVFIDPPGEGPFRRNINILQQSGPAPFTLDEYTDLSLKQIAGVPGSTTGESRPTKLSGSPAYRLAYRGDLGNGDLRFLAVWTIRSGKAWLVTYTADPARYNPGLPDVERLLSTIELPA